MPIRRFFKTDSTNPDDVRMTLGEHLEELRTRLIRAVAALVLGAIASYYFIDIIQAFLAEPVFAVLRRHDLPSEMHLFGVTERLLLEIKLALIIGFILTAPYSLAQLWGFVAAGLYIHERKWVRRFVPVSIALFFVGVIFFVVVVNPFFLEFMIDYSTKELPSMQRYFPTLGGDAAPSPTTQPIVTWPAGQNDPPPIPEFERDPENPPEGRYWMNKSVREVRIRFGDKIYGYPLREIGPHNRIVPTFRVSDYILLTLQMAAAFGIGFQVPVVVALLATIGIVSAAEMGRARRYVWFGIGVAAAFITPSPDVTSMMLLFIPMVLLYEAGLLAARQIERAGQKQTH